MAEIFSDLTACGMMQAITYTALRGNRRVPSLCCHPVRRQEGGYLNLEGILLASQELIVSMACTLNRRCGAVRLHLVSARNA